LLKGSRGCIAASPAERPADIRDGSNGLVFGSVVVYRRSSALKHHDKEVETMLMPLRSSRLALSIGWCRLLAACLILGAGALHVAYLTNHCTLDLAPDEAHYWDWSRPEHLDWSYYSKGPLIAYLIRGGCAVAGAWSVEHTGNLAFAVRLPAVLCGSLLLISLYLITVQVYRCEVLALAVVGIALTLPLLAVGSSLMTIDAPYTCCWGWALVLGHRAIFRGSTWAWPLLGVVLGLGMLAKYTMVVWIPSAALFLLLTPAYRPLLWQRGFWSMIAVAGLCCLPILIWNAQHDWVTFRHVLGLSGLNEAVQGPKEPRIHWLGPLRYLGGQCGLLLVYWFFVWLAAMIANRPGRVTDEGVLYLWWLSAPMFLLFLAFSPKTDGGELNWPVTAYLSGLVLSVAWLAKQFDDPRRWYRVVTGMNLGAACVVGLGVTVFVHHSELLYPLLTRLTGAPTQANRFPLRRLDPTCRLRGWRTLASEVDRLRAQLTVAEGRDPVLAGSSWSLPGELGVYCIGHPQAFSIGPIMGDRHSQYDFWLNPLDHGDKFRGQSFIVVNGDEQLLRQAFASVTTTEVIYREKGEPISSWHLSVCRDFSGRFPPPRKSDNY
jgi:4-amino-4-deoxy-L-arabinose transferase-like glycosyltransferase